MAGEGENDAVDAKKPRWRARLVKLGITVVLGLAALVALVFLGIDTGPGHRRWWAR